MVSLDNSGRYNVNSACRLEGCQEEGGQVGDWCSIQVGMEVAQIRVLAMHPPKAKARASGTQWVDIERERGRP